MRVAIAVRRLSPRGGLAGNVLALAEHQVRRGQRLTVVCPRVDPEVRLAAEIVRVRAPSIFGEAAKMLAFAAAARRAIEALEVEVSFASGQVDGVTVARLEGGLAAAYRDAAAAGRGLAGRWALGLDLPERAAVAIEARKLAAARRVLVLSEAARADVIRRYRVPPERVAVVRNGVDLERFRPPTAEERASARARLAVSGFVLAFVGRGAARKGLPELLRALAHPAAPRGATLLVAGAAPRELKATEAAAKSLGVAARLVGHQPDVREVFAAADAVALPSIYEPFGLVALEGLAMGRPALVSRAAGVSEVVPDPALVLEDPRDTEAFARALVTLEARAADPATAIIARRAAEAWPLERSLGELEAILLEEARRR